MASTRKKNDHGQRVQMAARGLIQHIPGSRVRKRCASCDASISVSQVICSMCRYELETIVGEILVSNYTSLAQIAEHAAAKALVGGRVCIFGPERGTQLFFTEIMHYIAETLAGVDYEVVAPQMVHLANGGRVLSLHRETGLLGRPIDLLIQLSPTRRGLVVEGMGGEVIDVRMVMSRNT